MTSLRFFFACFLLLAIFSFEQVASQHDYESAFMKQVRDTVASEPEDGMISKGRPSSLEDIERQQRQNRPKKWVKYNKSESEPEERNSSWLGRFEKSGEKRFNWSAITSAKALVHRLLDRMKTARNNSKPTNETYPDNMMIF